MPQVQGCNLWTNVFSLTRKKWSNGLDPLCWLQPTCCTIIGEDWANKKRGRTWHGKTSQGCDVFFRNGPRWTTTLASMTTILMMRNGNVGRWDTCFSGMVPIGWKCMDHISLRTFIYIPWIYAKGIGKYILFPWILWVWYHLEKHYVQNNLQLCLW